MWECADTVTDYFIYSWDGGEIENADAESEAGAMACGDALKLMFKMRRLVSSDLSAEEVS